MEVTQDMLIPGNYTLDLDQGAIVTKDAHVRVFDFISGVAYQNLGGTSLETLNPRTGQHTLWNEDAQIEAQCNVFEGVFRRKNDKPPFAELLTGVFYDHNDSTNTPHRVRPATRDNTGVVKQASYVDPGSASISDVVNALINAGIMAPS